jgi:hypothetical protein
MLLKTLLLAPMFLAVVSAQNSLSIRVYNRAGVPPRVLEAAIQETSRILARAGIETSWTEGPPDAPEACTFDFSGWSPYQHPNPDTRNYLVVVIGHRGQASGSRETLGFALPDASTGVHAFIFYDSLEQLTNPRVVTPPKMLGHAIAHEIGHVLLGSGHHSPAGLMKPRWDTADHMRAQAGMMQFTASETKIVRQRAALRMEIQKGFTSQDSRSIIP